MHLREVAVPVRIEQKSIGEARLTAARTRLRFIGGVRAHYQEDLAVIGGEEKKDRG